jgi:hypothetical protein
MLRSFTKAGLGEARHMPPARFVSNPLAVLLFGKGNEGHAGMVLMKGDANALEGIRNHGNAHGLGLKPPALG